MESNFVVVISIIAIVVIMMSLLIFAALMSKQKRRIRREDYPLCPDIIFNRYLLWYSSFTLWTFAEYVLMLVPLFTSLATIYFTTDFLSATNNSSAAWLSTMSFISALLPLINSKILPKAHANGFYRGAVMLEQGILQHKENFITTDKLLKIAEEAEKCTNSLENSDNQIKNDDRKTQIKVLVINACKKHKKCIKI